MRKLILFNMVTVEGFYEGPNGDINWHNVDEEFNEFAIEQLDSVSVILFGRVTYEMMASYWPTPAALSDDPAVAGKMNSMPKIVFSTSLSSADWQNTRLIKENIAEELKQLKQQPGKDLIIFGSGKLAASLTQLGLIDEYRIIIAPVAIGTGNPLFMGVTETLNLNLLKARPFKSGNVLLYYEPAK